MKPRSSEEGRVARFELTLEVQETADGAFFGEIEYASDLFEASTAERIARHWERLLCSLAADPDVAIESIPLLSEAERLQLISEFTRGEALEIPDESWAHRLFEAPAEDLPDAVAAVSGEVAVTYAELNRRANAVAHRLRQIGVGPGARVAICVRRGLAMLAGFMGVLKAGAAYVPLDPDYPSERLRFMLADSAPAAVLCDESWAGSGLAAECPVLGIADAWTGSWRALANPDPAQLGLSPEHLAYIIYTSGSTGRPKGVMVRHRNLTNLAIEQRRAFAVGPESRILQFASFSFDACVWETALALSNGAALEISPPWSALTGEDFVDVLMRRQVTLAGLPPAVLASLPADAQLACLSTLVVAGDKLTRSAAGSWAADRALINGYGPTETTVCATRYLCAPDDIGGEPVIGRPMRNAAVYSCDSSGGLAPIGVVGELYIGGAGLSAGYLNQPRLTAEKFVPDAFGGEAGSRLYRTGDLGRWRADGNIEFAGRADSQVKIRGFRIEPGEIEVRLCEHPGIREAAVVAREDVVGERRLVAYYTPEGEAADAEVLRAHLRSTLPEHMLPAAYVRLERMPRTPNGKLDRRALPAPEKEAFSARAYEAPRGEIESALAAIWAETLGVDRVGRQDNFFELGGHSLLAVTLAERMREAGYPVPVRALFAAPTLAGVAAALNEAPESFTAPLSAIPDGATRITPDMLTLIRLGQEEIYQIVSTVPGGAANIADIYPLTPLQEGILFHHRLGGEGDVYLLSSLLEFEDLDPLNAFLAALQAVVDRHDILRTAIVWESLREPVQVVWREAPLTPREFVPEAGCEDVARELRARFDPARYRIDLRQAPLLRVHFAHDERRNRRLVLLLLHHLAGDQTTMTRIEDELRALLTDRTRTLPPAVPFRDAVALSRLEGGQEEHERFFRNLLGDVDQPTAPFGLLDVRGDGSRIDQSEVFVPRPLAESLRVCARRAGVTAASLFHVAWARVLAGISGRQDVVFGTVLFGRMRGGIAAGQIMGPSINTLPVRLFIGTERADASVRRMHGLLADLMRHEHAPLSLAQRCSAVPAPTPLFSTLLSCRRHPDRNSQAAAATEGWRGIRVLSSSGRTNYPLTFAVDDIGRDFMLTAQSVAPIDPMRICGFMRTALESLVSVIESDSPAPLHSLEILGEDERRLLSEWSRGPEVAYDTGLNLWDRTASQADAKPDAIAAVSGASHLSYGELRRRAFGLGAHLADLGAGPESRVAIALGRGLDLIVSICGIAQSGAAYLPVDPGQPTERVRYMLDEGGARAIVSTRAILARWEGVADTRETIYADEWNRAHGDRPVEVRSRGRHANQLAYVIFTSGSTGRPKGVAIADDALSHYVNWAAQAYGEAEEIESLVASPVTFDATVTSLLVPLAAGGRIVLAREGGVLEDLAETLTAGRAVNLLKLTPSHLRALARSGALSAVPDFSRRVVVGGENLRYEDLRDWPARTEFINEYGPTETTVGCCVWRTGPEADRAGSVPIGRPIANFSLHVLDERMRPVPIGVSGELYIGGPGVARGYWNRARETSERFVPDPFGEFGARLYRTGDLAAWRADGILEFNGRTDDQVKIRGFRVELGEIAACLSEHPCVAEAVVVAEGALGESRLIAYFTPAGPNDAVDPEQLAAALAGKLPEYMLPAAYVRLDRIPLTVNGKVHRAALPAPEAGAFSRGEYEPPRVGKESLVASLWEEVLRISRVGRNDNFFRLGGHSLLAIAFVERLRAAGFDLDPRALFASPALSDIAAALHSRNESAVEPDPEIAEIRL